MSNVSEKALPNYKAVPLRSESIRVAVIQSAVKPVDGKNPKPGVLRNAEHLCWLVDRAQRRFGVASSHDLIAFTEFPITSYDESWDRADCLRVAIEIPGEETELLGQKAKQHNCYIAFGSWARHADWPGHFVSTGVVVGPSGDVVAALWKVRNARGGSRGTNRGALPQEMFATSVYDVLDQYVEMYGWDAVWPVARLDIGNIAMQAWRREPEIARAMAIMGTEILIKTAGGGGGDPFFRVDLQDHCLTNDFYGLYCTQAVSFDDEFIEDYGAGLSAIVDNQGRIIAETSSHHETVVSAAIPIGAFRRRHSIPHVCKDLYRGIWAEYEAKYPANTYLEHVPSDSFDSGRQVMDSICW